MSTTIVDQDVAKPLLSSTSTKGPDGSSAMPKRLTGTNVVDVGRHKTTITTAAVEQTTEASPSRAAASETQTHPSYDDTGEGPDWGVVLATGNEADALVAATSAVRRVAANTQQTSSDNGFRLIEALEAAEAAFDTKHADAPRTNAVQTLPPDTVATSTVASSGATMHHTYKGPNHTC